MSLEEFNKTKPEDRITELFFHIQELKARMDRMQKLFDLMDQARVENYDRIVLLESDKLKRNPQNLDHLINVINTLDMRIRKVEQKRADWEQLKSKEMSLYERRFTRLGEILLEVQEKITKMGLDLEQNKHHIVTLQQYYLEYIKPSTEEVINEDKEYKCNYCQDARIIPDNTVVFEDHLHKCFLKCNACRRNLREITKEELEHRLANAWGSTKATLISSGLVKETTTKKVYDDYIDNSTYEVEEDEKQTKDITEQNGLKNIRKVLRSKIYDLLIKDYNTIEDIRHELLNNFHKKYVVLCLKTIKDPDIMIINKMFTESENAIEFNSKEMFEFFVDCSTLESLIDEPESVDLTQLSNAWVSYNKTDSFDNFCYKVDEIYYKKAERIKNLVEAENNLEDIKTPNKDYTDTNNNINELK